MNTDLRYKSGLILARGHSVHLKDLVLRVVHVGH